MASNQPSLLSFLTKRRNIDRSENETEENRDLGKDETNKDLEKDGTKTVYTRKLKWEKILLFLTLSFHNGI